MLPQDEARELCKAITDGDTATIKKMINKDFINVNSVIRVSIAIQFIRIASYVAKLVL